ncbi:MAG: N-acetyltransferase [Betaproteobacteria bacterium]|nr:GNAT family N-acetyltransferase [Pseudomonadota bacterium]NBO13241.1 N-acetyltransferase [Betaproteobacteria bacterium]NBO43987.1 N-acetyltransferase [Betaproteobacteria bacterium]NBP11239.1 N-acetyltransferase [Betaproteobacteria bacterium]NBP62163.1 N-acetyltransferase [Betaproteobacteria bacterium]
MNPLPIRPAYEPASHGSLSGDSVALVPLAPAHGPDLFALSTASGADDRFRYLFDSVPTAETFPQFMRNACSSKDPLHVAVIRKVDGRCLGRQSLMRITPEHGVIEIGNILWGAEMARTRMASEAFFLHACYVFETLAYRRFEWKCNALNAPSRRAALRFGFRFEGIFRQHMVVKGESRDTAWYAMLDHEWPAIKAGFEAWLAAENFDGRGFQKTRLQCRSV